MIVEEILSLCKVVHCLMVSERCPRDPLPKALCHLDLPSTMEKNDLSKDIWRSRNGIRLSIGPHKLCVSSWLPIKDQEIKRNSLLHSRSLFYVSAITIFGRPISFYLTHLSGMLTMCSLICLLALACKKRESFSEQERESCLNSNPQNLGGLRSTEEAVGRANSWPHRPKVLIQCI